MASFLFRQGLSYVAGVDKPFVISKATIVEAVTDLGFRVLFADDCEELPRFPFPVPSGCGEDWDWVGYAIRTAPTERVDVPDRVRWIQEVPAESKPPAGTTPAKHEPRPPLPPTWHNPAGKAGGWIVPAAVGVLAGWVASRWWPS